MKKFLKFSAISLAVLVVLGIAAYFVIGSQWFIKSQVLPRVSAAIGAPVTAETVAFSPLSSLEMTGIRVGDAAKPLAEVKTLRVRYDALAALSKKLIVSELLVDGAKLTLEQKPDGTWNLPQLPASAKTATPANAAPGPFPYALDLRNIRITNAELSFAQSKPVPTTATVRDINLTIPAVRPGQPFNLDLSAIASAARNGETLADKLPVTAHTAFVMPEIGKLPERMDAQFQAGDILSAKLNVATLPKVGCQCQFDLTGKLAKTATAPEISVKIAATVPSAAQPFPASATITASLAPAESTLRLLVKQPVAPFTGAYTGTICLDSAQKITAKGSLTLDNLGLADSATGPKLPRVSAAMEHDVVVDLAANSATVSALAGSVTQNGRELASITLSAPATVAWGNAKAPEASPAKLAVVVKDFDVATLAPFLPASLPVTVLGGTINAETNLTIEKQGAAIAFDVTSSCDNMRLRQGTRDLPSFSNRKHATGTLTDFRTLNAKAEGTASVQGKAALKAACTVTADLQAMDADLTMELQEANEQLLAFVPGDAAKPVKSLNVIGTLKITAREKLHKVTAAGNVGIQKLEARMPDGAALPELQAAATFTAGANLADSTGSLEKFAFLVKQADRPVVTAELAAPVKLAWGAPAGFVPGDAELRLTVDALGLTQANAFLPPAAPRLAAGTLGATITAKRAEKGASVRATGDWAVQDLRFAAGEPALAVKSAFDVAFLPKSRDLRIATCALTAQQGDALLADLAITASTAVLPPFENRPMTLNLAGTSLDLLAIKELAAKLSGTKKSATSVPAETGGAPATEPPPVDLKGLCATITVNLKKASYGDIAITDIVTTLNVKNNAVTIAPSTLVLNGAPAAFHGTADLGASPWKYDISAKLDKLAIAPLVNSFAPQFKYLVSGEVKSIALSAAGAGITPANLSQNLKSDVALDAGGFVVKDLQKLVTDALSTKKGLGSVLEFAAKIGMGDMQQLSFDSIKFNLASENGRMQVKESTLAGPELMLSLLPGSSIGFDRTLDLALQPGFSGLLEKNIRQHKLGVLLGKQEGNYFLLPKTIPIRGNFGNPDSSGFDWTKLLLDVGKDKAVEAGNAAIGDLFNGKKVDGKKILGNLLNVSGSTTPAAPGTSTTTTTPAQQPEGVQPPQQLQPQQPVTPAPVPDEQPKKKKKKSDAWKELGAGLLNDALKK